MSHVTRTPHLKSNGQKSRSPGRCAQRCVGMSGGCSSGLENVLVVGNCCYIAICSVVEGASASRGEERGGSISWWLPAYSLFNMECKRNGKGTARSTSWATPSAYGKQNDGEPGQTAGWTFRYYEGHRPDALQGR